MNHTFAAIIVATVLMLCPVAMATDDVPDTADARALQQLLNDFLADVDKAAMHDRFWAEDLVYTSSSGSRRGKAEIMASFDTAPAPGEEVAGPTAADSASAQPAVPAVTYGAEEVRIREYGDAATVAFRLVAEFAATAEEPASRREFFNTGTFVKRDERWQVVAWQATTIPEDG